MPKFITNVGLAIIAGRMKGTSDEPLYLAWGSGAGVASAGSTDISTEETEDRTLMTSSVVTVVQTNDGYQLVGSIVADGNKTITNWGVFTASSGGILLLHESTVPG